MTEEQKNTIEVGAFVVTCVGILAILAAFAWLGHRQTGKIQQKIAETTPRREPADEEM